MPRTFTPTELHLHTGLKFGEFMAMSAEDRGEFNRQQFAIQIAASMEADRLYLQGDHDLQGSNRRFELGE